MNRNEYVSVWITPPAPQQSRMNGRRAFRCINCGKIVFEYEGDVTSILLGDNHESFPKVYQCKGRVESMDIMGNKFFSPCHTKYVIS